MKQRITILQLGLSEFYITQNREEGGEKEGGARQREEERQRNREHAVSGVGDFIKNSCVWELLSEPGLPDQDLCCQPSLGSTVRGE